MIPSFADQDVAAGSTVLIGRVRQALIGKAGELRLTVPVDANTWATHKMAQQVLERPDEWARRWTMALVATPAAAADPPHLTDAEITAGIEQTFPAFFEVPVLP